MLIDFCRKNIIRHVLLYLMRGNHCDVGKKNYYSISNYIKTRSMECEDVKECDLIG